MLHAGQRPQTSLKRAWLPVQVRPSQRLFADYRRSKKRGSFPFSVAGFQAFRYIPPRWGEKTRELSCCQENRYHFVQAGFLSLCSRMGSGNSFPIWAFYGLSINENLLQVLTVCHDFLSCLKSLMAFRGIH